MDGQILLFVRICRNGSQSIAKITFNHHRKALTKFTMIMLSTASLLVFNHSDFLWWCIVLWSLSNANSSHLDQRNLQMGVWMFEYPSVFTSSWFIVSHLFFLWILCSSALVPIIPYVVYILISNVQNELKHLWMYHGFVHAFTICWKLTLCPGCYSVEKYLESSFFFSINHYIYDTLYINTSSESCKWGFLLDMNIKVKVL